MATVMASRPVVLVVDDDDGVREGLCLELEADYEVLASSSGEAGLVEIGRRRVDLVLLDLLMPGLDGLQVLDRLRLMPGRPRVIFLSGIDRSAPAIEAIRRGADGWLAKPWDAGELLRQCRVLLTRRFIVHGGEAGIRASLGVVIAERCGGGATLCARRPDPTGSVEAEIVDASGAGSEPGLAAVLSGAPLHLTALSPLVTRVLHRVGLHFGEPGTVTVGALASSVGLTSKHLSERFRREIGVSLHDFVTRVRVEAVKERLGRPDCPPVERWAEDIGFCDASHLWKVFTRYEQHPPGRYRRNVQADR